jgi:diguanylate cyclase (GGDEF)-like protein
VDTRIVTGPLDARAVGRILAGISGGLGVDTGTAVHLATRSGGNALALLEYLEALVAAGLLRPSWGHWELDVVRAGDIPLADSAVDLVARRIEGLSPDTRRLLGVAAVLGTTFSTDLVAQVSSTDLQRVLQAVAEASWTHLLEPQTDGEHAFSHDCVREALLAQFTEGERRRLHQRVADDLEGSTAGCPYAVFAAAWHTRNGETAHNQAQLFRTHRAAGILALHEHAPERAVEYLRQAVDAGSTGEPVPDVDLHVALGIAGHHTGRFEDAVTSYRRALEVSRDPVERASIRYLVALVHDSTRNSPEEISGAEQGLAELGIGLPRNRLLLVASSLGLFLLGVLAGLTRAGLTRVGRSERPSPRRERYRVITLLYALLALGHVRELRPDLVAAVCCRQLFSAGRAGFCAANVQTRAFLAIGPSAFGLRRTAAWISRGAARDARRLGDRRAQALVAWMSVQGALFAGDDGTRLRSLLHEHARWLDPGLVLDALDALCWDALLHGDTDQAEETFALRRRGVGTVRHGHDVADGGTDRDGVTTEAGLEAMSGRPGAAMSRLALARVAPGRSRWRQLDQLVVTLQCAIEQGDPGEVLDRTIEEFRATGLSRRQVFPSHLVLYAYQAYGRLEQCRTAPAEHRDDRLAQATEAVAELGRVTARPLLAAHHRVAQAALLQLSGQNVEALAHLEGAAAVLYGVESPLADFEAARIRARALMALGHRFEAEIQARCALLIASSQRWPHRARWVRSEFGTMDETGAGGCRPVPDEVLVHGHQGGPDGEVRIRLAALDHLSQAAVADVETTTDPEEVLRQLQDAVAAAVECDRLWLVRPGDPGWSGVADVAVQDTPLIGDEETAGPVVSRLPAGTDPTVRSWMAVPLRRGIRQIGVMLLASADPCRFGPHQAALAAAVVAQGLVAHDNAHLLGEIRRLATTDDLTGIPNRRHLLDLADRWLSWARASGRPLVAMMIGIDGVQEVNESSGQRVGDQVIRAVAQRLQGDLADDDVLGRYTGTELVLLSAVDEGVDAMAERLRRAVSDAPVATSVGPLGVTVSIGLVCVRSDDRDIGSVVRRADRNLRHARKAGRNRVCGDHRSGDR